MEDVPPDCVLTCVHACMHMPSSVRGHHKTAPFLFVDIDGCAHCINMPIRSTTRGCVSTSSGKEACYKGFPTVLSELPIKSSPFISASKCGAPEHLYQSRALTTFYSILLLQQ